LTYSFASSPNALLLFFFSSVVLFALPLSVPTHTHSSFFFSTLIPPFKDKNTRFHFTNMPSSTPTRRTPVYCNVYDMVTTTHQPSPRTSTSATSTAASCH
jgi:hypothetical protein